VNLIEVLPKEKKQKEEKIQPLGQCTFDVLPIIRGETKVVLKLTMFPVAGSSFELLQQQQPEIPLVNDSLGENLKKLYFKYFSLNLKLLLQLISQF
jgi:hypothetical protein